MFKTLLNKYCKKKVFALGGPEDGDVTQYTIFEFRRFASLYVHVFNTQTQEMLHSHDFSAVAVMFKGSYDEEVQSDIGCGEITRKTINPGIRFIPRGYNHRICKSKPDTMTLLFAGPRLGFWTEETDDYIRMLGFGRVVLVQGPKTKPTKSNDMNKMDGQK